MTRQEIEERMDALARKVELAHKYIANTFSLLIARMTPDLPEVTEDACAGHIRPDNRREYRTGDGLQVLSVVARPGRSHPFS
jgi:hypothetical protein